MLTYYLPQLICCAPDPFNHIVDPCRPCLANTVMLLVVIPHKAEYTVSNEIYDSEI